MGLVVDFNFFFLAAEEAFVQNPLRYSCGTFSCCLSVLHQALSKLLPARLYLPLDPLTLPAMRVGKPDFFPMVFILILDHRFVGRHVRCVEVFVLP